jgi:4-hydroxybenzoate polyprenyltransferase
MTSAIYIFNDYFDIEEDKLHPLKKNRSFASGKISKSSAFPIVIILLILGGSFLAVINPAAFWLALSYVVLNVLYTLKLKHVPIIDLLIISSGFVIRLFIGSVVASVNLTDWILIMTFLLSLFLALAKRREDILIYLETGVKTRKAIDGYNIEFLNAGMIIMASVSIVSYIMYTISPIAMYKAHSQWLYLTAIFVISGILRYLQITLVENGSGSPTNILLKDRFIQFSIIGWIIMFGFFLYFL